MYLKSNGSLSFIRSLLPLSPVQGRRAFRSLEAVIMRQVEINPARVTSSLQTTHTFTLTPKANLGCPIHLIAIEYVIVLLEENRSIQRKPKKT